MAQKLSAVRYTDPTGGCVVGTGVLGLGVVGAAVLVPVGPDVAVGEAVVGAAVAVAATHVMSCTSVQPVPTDSIAVQPLAHVGDVQLYVTSIPPLHVNVCISVSPVSGLDVGKQAPIR